MKRAIFHPFVKKEVKSFPVPVRNELGFAIYRLQCGDNLKMPLSKPMPEIGKGVSEIRLKDQNGIYRAFYYTKLKDTVLVFHAFRKKTNKTTKLDIQNGKTRLKELLDSI